MSASAATSPTPAQSSAVQNIEEQAILAAYQKTETHGLEFGRLCYEYREKSEVVSGGTTFSRMLEKLGIPRKSAYRWIARYEELIGIRQPEPEPETEDIVEDANDPPQLQDAKPTAAPSKPKQIHVSGDENAPLFWKTLGNKLNALLPTYSDGSEHAMVTMLEQARTEPLSKDATVLKSIVVMLKKISSEYAEHAQKLEARMKFEEIAEIVQVEEQMAPPSGGVSIPTSPLQYTEASC